MRENNQLLIKENRFKIELIATLNLTSIWNEELLCIRKYYSIKNEEYKELVLMEELNEMNSFQAEYYTIFKTWDKMMVEIKNVSNFDFLADNNPKKKMPELLHYYPVFIQDSYKKIFLEILMQEIEGYTLIDFSKIALRQLRYWKKACEI
jgi:hypothetical protein